MSDRANKYTQINKKQDLYSDFLLNMTAHPFTNDLARVRNEDAVKRAIRNLILTNRFERPYHPNIGGHINKFLFEDISIETQKSIEESIKLTIENYEKRANLLQLVVTPDYDAQTYNITIVFNTVNNPNPIDLTITLERLR